MKKLSLVVVLLVTSLSIFAQNKWYAPSWFYGQMKYKVAPHPGWVIKCVDTTGTLAWDTLGSGDSTTVVWVRTADSTYPVNYATQKVGIGTNSPKATLDINGDIHSNWTSGGKNYGIYTTDDYLGLGIPMFGFGRGETDSIALFFTDQGATGSHWFLGKVEPRGDGDLFAGADRSVQVGGTNSNIFLDNNHYTDAGYPNYSLDDLSDSSTYRYNILGYQTDYGNNILSGGMENHSNTLWGGKSTMIDNVQQGIGTDLVYPGIQFNYLWDNSHIDSNTLIGNAVIWDMLKHSENSYVRHNYIQCDSTSIAQLDNIAGNNFEFIMYDSIITNNNPIPGRTSGIKSIVLLGRDSIINSTINGMYNLEYILMSHSTIDGLKYYNGTQQFQDNTLLSSSLYNIKGTVKNSFFHNVRKDFASDTSSWSNIVLFQDYIGINTNGVKPTAALQVNGSFKYTDGNQAANKVLLSDASGNATWQRTDTIISPTITGDGSTTAFTIAHGLGVAPKFVSLTAKNANAASGGVPYLTYDATNIVINFTTAPSSGSAAVDLFIKLK